MIASQNLDPALQKIEQLFVDQCTHGAQSADVGPDGAACGQFLGDYARPQRGLHGTAAALRVLSQGTSTEAANLVRRLVWYVENRQILFKDGKEPVDPSRFSDDENNVIKLSEILYALAFVQASQSLTDQLVRLLAERLIGGIKEDKGWCNFLDIDGPVDPLPTAFAVLALSSHGLAYEQRISKPITYLTELVTQTAPTAASNINETSVKIFCVFALTFRRDELSHSELTHLKKAFNDLWKAYERLLTQDLEQNIEYSIGPRNYYVRVPWQLYLLALGAVLDPKRLSSFKAQKRLAHILHQVTHTGFRYPYSGAPISSRTSAILFDLFLKIKRHKNRGVIYRFYFVVDSLRTFLSLPFFTWLIYAVMVILAIYCIRGWAENHGEPRELGPELIVAISVFFFDKLRKPR